MPFSRLAAAGLVSMMLLAGCGQRLGSYRVEDVRVVQRMRVEDAATGGISYTLPPYTEFLRIELSSTFDLAAARIGPGLYTDADFCPLRDGKRIIAFQPLAANGFAVGGGRDGPGVRDRHDGRFHYVVHVVPDTGPLERMHEQTSPFTRYDLRTAGKGLCLRFFVPGYNVTPSVSDTVEVTPVVLARAFAAAR